MEEYDPAHGQMIAWVQIPTLSHTSDTVIYLFYGNPNITTPQQNPAGVWTSNYLGVYHLTNVASGAAADSTANANNGVAQGIAAINGQIDGAGSFNGSNSNIQLPQLNIGNVMSASAWFQTTANGVIFGNANTTLGSSPGVYNPILYVGIDSLLRGGIDNGYEPPLASQGVVNDGKWHLAYYTSDGTTQNLYLDGKLQISAFAGDNSNAHYFFGTDFTWGWAQSNWNWFYLSGAIDETRISNTALSADWIATEYANQSSPSTFYQLYSENFEGIVPSAIALYASQSEQFTAVNGCGTAAVSWSMPAGSPGTLASGGLYTAPASISTPQSVTVTASSQANGSPVGTATVSLRPAITVSIAPVSVTVTAGQSQQYIATVGNANNTGVVWSFGYAGLGTITSTGLFTASPSITQPVIVAVTATSQADPTVSASARVTLLPAVTVTINPSTMILAANQTEQFAATVSAVNYDCYNYHGCAS